MHYAYTLELAFDPVTHAAIQKNRTDLERAAMGNARALALFQPHVSLVVGHDVDVSASLPILQAWAQATPSFPLTFSYLGIFNPPSAILYLGVTVTHALLTLHSTFTSYLTPLMGDVWAHYTEGVWVPHCTLTVELNPADLPTAVARCASIELPFVARAVAVELVQVTRHNTELLGRFAFDS
jgi:2'-5' RNA ligase